MPIFTMCLLMDCLMTLLHLSREGENPSPSTSRSVGWVRQAPWRSLTTSGTNGPTLISVMWAHRPPPSRR